MQNSNSPIPWEWVNDSVGLNRAIEAVKSSNRIYMDLEADSMHHYFAKVCLIQVLAEGTCYLVDPLSGIDIRPFVNLLSKKPIVSHGADYDLRMLFQQYDFHPVEIFDTMIAAQLLGRTAFGLAALVQELKGIAIAKEAQKADWSQRPLPIPMLDYAAQDTAFLPELFSAQLHELEEKGRLTWHQESCEALIRATKKTREVDSDLTWRIAGSARMHPQQLAILKEMWELREQLAKASDLPPYKILPSEILLRFAESITRNGVDSPLPKMPSRLHPESRQRFLQTFEQALLLPMEKWPSPPPPTRPPPKSPHPDLLTEIRKIRDQKASELGLDPSLLAPKAVMLSVAITGLKDAETANKSTSWMRWQEKLLLASWLEAGKRFTKQT